MRTLILGGDGYLGWPTAMYLSRRGHEVAVVDNYFRRRACTELNCEPLLAGTQPAPAGRTLAGALGLAELKSLSAMSATTHFLSRVFQEFGPEGVVHYAEQPSAPYSMMGREAAVFTLTNNLVSTCNLIHAVAEFNPDCHIVKLGTMGVYGTPNIDIEEGYLEVEHKGRKHKFLYPKAPGSLYHLTKAQDGDMLYFYCRMWDIRVTDLNQGPVYGVQTEESAQDDRLASIFNYDDIFGTVLEPLHRPGGGGLSPDRLRRRRPDPGLLEYQGYHGLRGTVLCSIPPTRGSTGSLISLWRPFR